MKDIVQAIIILNNSLKARLFSMSYPVAEERTVERTPSVPCQIMAKTWLFSFLGSRTVGSCFKLA